MPIQEGDYAPLVKLPPAFQTVVEASLLQGLNSTSNGWTLYKQCDSRWAGQELGNCGSETICSAGCAMSSVAMIVATKGGGKKTPL